MKLIVNYIFFYSWKICIVLNDSFPKFRDSKLQNWKIKLLRIILEFLHRLLNYKKICKMHPQYRYFRIKHFNFSGSKYSDIYYIIFWNMKFSFYCWKIKNVTEWFNTKLYWGEKIYLFYYRKKNWFLHKW